MKILMVCLGNICRSPLAQGILEHNVVQRKLPYIVDSAGTSDWHIGELPDRRSVQIAQENGIDITHQRSRKFIRQDFSEFDLILAMDTENYRDILTLAQNEKERNKVKMILNYVYPGQNRAVPDPYYHGGFEKVYMMLDKACEKLLDELEKRKE